jgi:hypothetical protein
MGYQLEGPGSILDSVSFFSSPHHTEWLWGPPSLLSTGYGGGFLPWGAKWQEREADHAPPTSAEVKKGAAIPLLPHTPSWRSAQLSSQSDNLTVPYKLAHKTIKMHKQGTEL